MNYELLLDEIMVNSVGAKEIIWAPGKEIHYGVCPLQLEYHTSIFLAGALLSFGQNRPMLFLVQVEELEEDVMIFDGEIGPHFWKRYQLWSYGNSFPKTSEKAYHYLDKLFAYTAVLNSRVDHQVIFVKKGVKSEVWVLSSKSRLVKDTVYLYLVMLIRIFQVEKLKSFLLNLLLSVRLRLWMRICKRSSRHLRVYIVCVKDMRGKWWPSISSILQIWD